MNKSEYRYSIKTSVKRYREFNKLRRDEEIFSREKNE